MASELKQEADAKIDRAISLSIALSGTENGNETLKEKAETLRNSLKKLISEKIVQDDEITLDEWNEVFHGLPAELLSYFQIADMKGLKVFIEKTSTAPVIFSKENQPPILSSGRPVEPISSVEKTEGYLLSKKDFELYFAWDAFQQQNVGNCYLVTAINSLVNFWWFEELIRKSVSRTEGGFEIMLPLWMLQQWIPKEYVKVFKVSKSELGSQIGIFGSQFSLMKWKDGIKALMVAYGKSVTGKNTFDLLNLEGWDTKDTIKSLIYGIFLYDHTRGSRIDGTKNFESRLQSSLMQFDSHTDIMTLSVNQGENYSQLLKLDEKDDNGKTIQRTHAISVIAVDKDRREVTLSNPWNCNKRFTVSIDALQKLCYEFQMASKEEKQGLVESDYQSEDDHRISKMVLNRDANNMKKIRNIPSTIRQIKNDPNLMIPLVENILHGSNWPKNPESLNQAIQATGNSNPLERLSRGDVVVEERDRKYYIESHGQKDSYITFDEKYNPTIHFGKSNLSLPSWVFANTFNGESNKLVSWYLYPPRLVVFLNKIKHDYIDTSFYKSNTGSPFVLWKNGECLLMDDPDKYQGTKKILKKAGDVLWDTSISVLKDWSALGIKSSDIETKKQIIWFLNNISQIKKSI